MAYAKVHCPCFLIFSYLLLSLVHLNSSDAQDLKACKFNTIYQFGDSISDTGNAIIEFPILPYGRFPYGISVKEATGRPSDGWLMIDYIAQSAGLPLLEPYENPNSNFTQGVDFSVAGVTAVSVDTLIKWDIPPFVTNNSLMVQVDWFNKYLPTFCTNVADCQEKIKSSLFMIGTIGFNDYNLAFGQNKTLEEIKNIMVPGVVQTIIDSVKKIISFGATQVVVTGTFQMGCTPGLLTMFSTNTSAAYDAHGCLKDYNDFFMYHNSHLQVALEGLRKEYPNIHIIYGDIYNALQSILDNFSKLGFKSLTQACCGIGGKYNYSRDRAQGCGQAGVPVCSNPAEYVFWDVAHFTHQANKYLSEWLIKNMLPQLQCA